MENEFRIESRPWEPQDLIDDLQLMIDEEPYNYLNGNRTTLCMARDYLKKFFAEESLRPKGRWIMTVYTTTSKRRRVISNKKFSCSECGYGNGRKQSSFCPNCGAKMGEG